MDVLNKAAAQRACRLPCATVRVRAVLCCGVTLENRDEGNRRENRKQGEKQKEKQGETQGRKQVEKTGEVGETGGNKAVKTEERQKWKTVENMEKTLKNGKHKENSGKQVKHRGKTVGKQW